MKFIHTSDLHIDSPLRGLQQYEGAPVERLREATRDAFENLVTLAIDERVDFVIVAGDLFDGRWQDMQTGVWTANQFRRLERESIGVYLIRGNHDATSRLQQSIRWPANVHEFPTTEAHTFVLESLGVALHGQGFGHHEIPDDLVPGYPEPIPGLFNIGVLHTSLTGDSQHDTYAPTNEDILVARGYDYWALGHIHARRTIREQPYVAFSGNTQGRNVRETGPKGCLLVSVADGHVESVIFRATDTLRWHVAEIHLSENSGVSEMLDLVRCRLKQCHQESEGRFCTVRVALRGACPAHRQLMDSAEQEQLIAEIHNLANDLDEEVWVEKIEIDTSPPIDVKQLLEGTDLLGDLLRYSRQAQGDEQELAGMARVLKTLTDRAPSELDEAGVDLENPERMREWLQQAERLLLSQLTELQA